MIEVNGRNIETTENGYLVNVEDWDESVAEHIAGSENIELTEKHWDLIRYLRDEFINNGGNNPSTRHILKAMKAKWSGENVDNRMLYELFPDDPSKQGGRIAGLPESKRKGGY